MKKTTIYVNDLPFTLYADVDAVYGGWLMETSGEACCLNQLEDVEADSEIAEINEVIADPATPWEKPTVEDIGYVRDVLQSWGISAESL